uniref:Uncharacterized protein n=1 Tax=Anguilla anguilla TaxID=7936 RepID=A0A0E9SJ79_ANGAN
MSDMLQRYEPARSLRPSGTSLLVVPKVRTKKAGEAAFSFYAPQPLEHPARGSE